MKIASTAIQCKDAADKVEFSVVIPVYNSENFIEPLVQSIGDVFRTLDRTYEIVLTDDGSQDGSWGVIRSLHARGEPIRAFKLMKNHGQHYALKCGLDQCAGQFAITMDDDFQNPPGEIPKLIEAIESDPEIDVVIGKYGAKKHSLFRNIGTWIHKRLRYLIFDDKMGLSLTSFRIINRPVIEEIKKVRHARPRIGLIILTITSRIKNIPVRHDVRKEGSSGYTLVKMVSNTLDNIINYSALPLRAVSYTGLLSSFLSLALAIFYLIKYFIGDIQVSGFMTTILLILFTSGIILFSFGLVGEYLIRIISQQLMHTQYSVRTMLTPTIKVKTIIR